jgi:peroxiredoxin/thioredoxin-like negative regulator of GroEL
MSGVGNVHLPVTTSNPLAQKFFDQGVNLLYCFSWYEAERSFRQAAHLDPNCAMAYWGMAMCDNSRGKEFLAIGQQKMQHITNREKRYIDALAINFRAGDEKSRVADNIAALEAITFAYPDDVEAKAMLAWALYRQQQSGSISYRAAIDALLRQVLAKNPMHPGAHHFRIHMWDGIGAENALDSCKALSKAAPSVGHALHMPGHIYARLGMWDDATHSMDASARAERIYFYNEHELPYESWDYAHDQDFLISSLGYNGRLREGEALAWELVDIPHDPQYNSGSTGSTAGTGRFGLMRMRVRGERWDEILTGADPGWTDSAADRAWVAYSRGLAYLGKNDLVKAREQLAGIDKIKAGGDPAECARQELRGRIDVVSGDAKVGIELIKKAAETEKAKFKYGDPIGYPRPLYETLAWAQIFTRQYKDAEDTLKEGLERNPNNGFALCLKIQCLAAEGNLAEAAKTYAQLGRAWAHADPEISVLQQVKLLNLGESIHPAPFPTPYHSPPELTRIGPASWEPFPVPNISVLDQNGAHVRLSEFTGHNLILIFTLGGSCPRCNKQLEEFSKEEAAFAALDTTILAVSSDSVESIKAYNAGSPDNPLHILSDPLGIAARQCKAHDDFENLDLHALLMIDRKGRVWWFRAGTEPFDDLKFLKEEIVRMDAWEKRARNL